MERLIEKAIQAGLIDEGQKEWLLYWLQCRIMNAGGFFILICAGALFFPLSWVLLLNLGLVFLRSKTNGLHMPTKRSCMVFSLLCEYGCLFAIQILQTSALTVLIMILALSTILICGLAPCNNSAVHYSHEELKVMHKAVMQRLCLYDLVVLILLLQAPSVAVTLIVAETAVALLVVLAKLGVGIQ